MPDDLPTLEAYAKAQRREHLPALPKSEPKRHQLRNIDGSNKQIALTALASCKAFLATIGSPKAVPSNDSMTCSAPAVANAGAVNPLETQRGSQELCAGKRTD